MNKNCIPELKDIEPERVLFWKDWVYLLGGGESNAGITPYPANFYAGLRIQSSTTPSDANHRNWGRTYGAYKGYNGRPISESKLLDESFWYYNGYVRQTISWENFWPCNACKIYVENFNNSWNNTDSGNFYWNGSASVKYTNPIYHNIFYLEPGVYGATVAIYSSKAGIDQCGFFQISPDNSSWDYLVVCHTNLADSSYHFATCIFFVDTGCYIRASHASDDFTCQWFHAQVFRITPPGYWHL